MGGFIGLRLAARRPDLVSSVLVMGTSADVEEAAEQMEGLAEVFAAHGMEPVIDPVLHFMMGGTTLTDPSRADVLAGARELLLTRTPEYADSVRQIAHRKPILDELPTITVPPPPRKVGTFDEQHRGSSASAINVVVSVQLGRNRSRDGRGATDDDDVLNAKVGEGVGGDLYIGPVQGHHGGTLRTL